MPSKEQYLAMQQKNLIYIAEKTDADIGTISFDMALSRCQDFIERNMTTDIQTERRLDIKERYKTGLINAYVERKSPIVEGYKGTDNGIPRLKEDLCKTVLGYGKLNNLMMKNDLPDSPGFGVDEIRINDKSNIWTERGGKAQREPIILTDNELQIITTKLLEHSRAQLNPNTPVANTSTKEGYRVNLILGKISHRTDTVAVIRKFKSIPPTPRQLIESKTFSVNMYKTMVLTIDSDSSFVVVGATGSGKTVTNGVMLGNVRNNVRIISIENPVELPLEKYDVTEQFVINDVLQFQAESKTDNPDALISVEDMITTALRQSPHWLILGEARSPGEFVAALRAGQTGHCFCTTYHANSGTDALKRYLTAYMTISTEPANLAMANICATIRFIYSQQKMADHTRKVVEISEVFPPKTLDSVEPELHNIYSYVVPEDGIVYDETKPYEYIVKEIRGQHKRVGCIDNRTKERWLKGGVSSERYKYLTNPVDVNEVERYTVEDTDHLRGLV